MSEGGGEGRVGERMKELVKCRREGPTNPMTLFIMPWAEVLFFDNYITSDS